MEVFESVGERTLGKRGTVEGDENIVGHTNGFEMS